MDRPLWGSCSSILVSTVKYLPSGRAVWEFGRYPEAAGRLLVGNGMSLRRTLGQGKTVGRSPSFQLTLVGGQWRCLQRPWREREVGIEGVHLHKVVKRRKRGIQKETKGDHRGQAGAGKPR